jgi:iron complex outermembrane recepter protein
MKKVFMMRSVIAGSLIASGVGAAAFAQDTSGDLKIEEIIITAEKRQSSIQDTAIAISAFDSDMRDELGINGATDIANFTPGMTYNGSPNRIFIRGVGRVDNSLGSEPGVAIYRDGVYTNEAASVSDDTFFVERIEILRGPQGTLYGRNAIGGAAAIISKRPTEEFGGELRLGAYSYGGQSVQAAISGPISDTIRYRIAGQRTTDDGWVKNLAAGKKNLSNQDFTRYDIQLEWDITDRLSWWIEYNNYEWDTRSPSRGGGMDPYNTASPGAPVGNFTTDFQQLVANPTLGYTGADPQLGEVNMDEEGYVKNPGSFVTSHISYDFDKGQLKYIFGFNQYEWDYLSDYDLTSRSDLQYDEIISQHEEYMQHEIQFVSDLGGDIEFIVGAFYYRDDLWQPYRLADRNNPVLATPVWAEFFNWASFDPVGPPPVVPICNCIVDAPANPNKYFYDQEGAMNSESYAAYGQVDYYLNDEWHIAVGLRYSKDDKEGYEKQRIIFDGQGTYAFLANFWPEFFDDGGAINPVTVSPYPPISWFNAATAPGGVVTPGPQARIAWDFYNGYREATHVDSWDAVTWSIGADWKPNDDTMLYAKVSTGYKAGGFRLGSLQANQGVNSENLLAYEAGAKLTLGDTLQVNLATYLYDYEDMQVPVAAIINGVNNTFFQNLEKANQFGIEMDAQWLASEGLTLYATYTYMDTEIERFGGSGAIDSTDICSVVTLAGCAPEEMTGSQLSGNSLLLAPQNKFTANGVYTWYFNSGDEFSLAVSYVYQSEQFSEIFNRLDTQVPGWQNVDLRVNFRRPDSGLRITGYIRNALDEDIIESISRTGWYFNNTRNASLRPPRTVGVEVNIEF